MEYYNALFLGNNVQKANEVIVIVSARVTDHGHLGETTPIFNAPIAGWYCRVA